MPEASATNHGKLLDRMARIRCTQFLMMLLGFNLVSSVLRNTVSLLGANQAAAVSVAEEEHALAQARRHRDDLTETKRFYQSDDGIVAAARPLGYGREGERRVMFSH